LSKGVQKRVILSHLNSFFLFITSFLFTFLSILKQVNVLRPKFNGMQIGVLKPKGNSYLISRNQTSAEIAGAIVKAIEDSKPSANFLAHNFKNSSKLATAKLIFIFCKNAIPYVKESGEYQTAKTLPRILKDQKGDCKHMSIAVASLLKACGIPCKLRLVSQRMFDTTPNHIYVVAMINGKEIICDCVLKAFDTECNFYTNYDIKV